MVLDIERRVIRKIWRRVIWVFMLLWFLNYLDRNNVAFAALQMNKELAFSATVYGLGAGLFFLPYAVFELPSNLILHRIGARVWLSLLCIAWGVVSMCFAALNGVTMFYVLRFLLGMVEAGFVPGVCYYLTYWLPMRHRAGAFAFLFGASVLSSIFGAPLSGWLLSAMSSVGGVGGWRWMFLVEGVPSVLLGVALFAILVDTPKQAPWLTAEERDWLGREIDGGIARGGQRVASEKWWTDSRVWILSLIWVFVGFTTIGVFLWLPLILKSFGGLSTIEIGFLTSVPYICSYLTMQWIGRHSDRTGERKLHIAISAAIGGLALIASANSPSNVIAFLALCVAISGLFGYLGVFWAASTSFLEGVGAAAALAVISAIGQIGSFLGPYTVGWLRDATGSFTASLTILGCGGLLQAVIVLLSRIRRQSEPGHVLEPTR
jgi:MFS transporter, ACS family, tartrate transporter